MSIFCPNIEFLKRLLVLAKKARQAEKEVISEKEVDRGKAALTELFNGIKNDKTPIIVERIVTDIDSIVKIVRFDSWQNTSAGQKDVKKALRCGRGTSPRREKKDRRDRGW